MDYRKQIEELVGGNNVVIFMKGNYDSPMCRFSAAAVKLLKKYGIVNPVSVDILADEGMRQAIKDFSDWPTLPQIYVRGKFIGGADILAELDESGELEKVLMG